MVTRTQIGSVKVKDRRGLRYGRLVVINFAGLNRRGQANWLCKCDCGRDTVAFGGNLNSGQARSCGCIRLEGNNFKHGHAKTRSHSKEYDCWVCMKSRIFNPKNKRFADYGGRGITICDRWLGRDGFSNFHSDMGDKPDHTRSIDRIDVNGNYCPENCIWGTKEDQARNKRNSRIISYNGETRCLAEWSEILNIPYGRLWKRLDMGFSLEQAADPRRLTRERTWKS